MAELVVCVPVIVLLVFASIEACSMIFVRQAMTAAAYEGLRLAVKENGTTRDARQMTRSVLRERNVRRGTIRFTPRDITRANPGQTLSVRITVPCDDNSIMPPWFFGGRSLVATGAMVKE